MAYEQSLNTTQVQNEQARPRPTVCCIGHDMVEQ